MFSTSVSAITAWPDSPVRGIRNQDFLARIPCSPVSADQQQSGHFPCAPAAGLEREGIHAVISSRQLPAAHDFQAALAKVLRLIRMLGSDPSAGHDIHLRAGVLHLQEPADTYPVNGVVPRRKAREVRRTSSHSLRGPSMPCGMIRPRPWRDRRRVRRGRQSNARFRATTSRKSALTLVSVGEAF